MDLNKFGLYSYLTATFFPFTIYKPSVTGIRHELLVLHKPVFIATIHKWYYIVNWHLEKNRLTIILNLVLIDKHPIATLTRFRKDNSFQIRTTIEHVITELAPANVRAPYLLLPSVSTFEALASKFD